LVQYRFSLLDHPHHCLPLGSDVHDQDDLSLELREIVLLVAGEFGLEVVELGHCTRGVSKRSGKPTIRVEVKMRSWLDSSQRNCGRRSYNHGKSHARSRSLDASPLTFVLHHPSPRTTTVWECLMANG